MFSKFIYIVLMAFFISPVVADQISDNILREKTLYKFSYHGTQYYKYPSSICETYEKPIILAIKRQFQGIKSNKEIKNHKSTYYRFTLAVEEYKTAKIAKERLKQITFPYKFKNGSWYSKNCSLREGFLFKNKVYFLSTDAKLFSSEITHMLNLLSKALIKCKRP